MTVFLKGGLTAEDPRLDALPETDPRNDDYPVRAAIVTPPPLVPKAWTLGPVTDQGQEGACVGHSWTQELMASPDRVHIGPGFKKTYDPRPPNDFAYAMYKVFQRNDEFPGEAYSGTSVLAGAKVLHRKGLIQEYRWAKNVKDLRDAILTLGPCILTIPWLQNFMWPTDNVIGFGDDNHLMGWHAILCYGWSPEAILPEGPTPVFRLRNSWGPSYGKNGRVAIRSKDLKSILFPTEGVQGSACIPVLRRH